MFMIYSLKSANWFYPNKVYGVQLPNNLYSMMKIALCSTAFMMGAVPLRAKIMNWVIQFNDDTSVTGPFESFEAASRWYQAQQHMTDGRRSHGNYSGAVTFRPLRAPEVITV